MARSSLRVTLALFFFLGCGPAEEESPTLVRAGSMEVSTELLIQGEVTWAAALSNLDILVVVDGLVKRIDGVTGSATSIFGDPGEVYDVVELDDGTVLLSGTEGLFAVQHGELAPSPLSGALGAAGPSRMLVTAEGDLWLASETGLHLWRDSVLYDVDAGDFPTGSAALAWGPAPGEEEDEGAEGLWIASASELYFLRPDGGGYVAESVRRGASASAVAVDGHLSVWGVVDGDLHRRSADGVWSWLELPAAVSGVAGVRGSMSTWLSTEAELWHFGHDGWSSTDQFGLLMDVDGAGRALVADDAGLLRVWAGRPLLLFGLDDGAQLEFAVEVLLVAAPAGVSPRSYVVTVDGAEIELGEGPSVFLDPIAFADGPHELVASAYYRNGMSAEAKIYFTVGDFVAPTWSEDIQPLHDGFCTPCHAPEGSGHLMHTSAAWEAEIDLILKNVESGSMPLNNDTNPTIDALSPAEIQSIRGWAAGGFLQ